jgi:hypothetical protein
MTDFMYSGVLHRYLALKLLYAEAQVGWVPFRSRSSAKSPAVTPSRCSASPSRLKQVPQKPIPPEKPA